MLVKRCFLFLLLILNISIHTTAAAQEKLIFAIDLIRHGDRSPLIEIPNSPYHWPQALGELSAEGMQQEYQLGVKMRQKYVTRYHLLPAHYDSEAMYVRSSDYNRTLMSAESLLLGLYPLGTGPKLSATAKFALPNGYQAIPIHTIPREQDDLLLPGEYGDAAKHRQALLQQYVYSTPEWKEKNAALREHYAAWSNATGLSLKELKDLGLFADHLLIRQDHQVALPKGITSDDVDTLLAAQRWSYPAEFKPQVIGDYLGHTFVATAVDYLQKATQQNSPLKYILFSAHDSTLLGVMSALHVPLDEPPHYASNLNFALFETDLHEYVVRITYNDKPVSLPACGGERCTLPQLLELSKT